MSKHIVTKLSDSWDTYSYRHCKMLLEQALTMVDGTSKKFHCTIDRQPYTVKIEYSDASRECNYFTIYIVSKYHTYEEYHCTYETIKEPAPLKIEICS